MVVTGTQQQLAARLHGAKDLRIERIEVPRPTAGQVLVRVACVGVCGSDVHFYKDAQIGPTEITQPLVLGHEPSGTIVELGEGVASNRLGERVSIEPGEPCGNCRECTAGQYHLCENINFFAFPPTDGALCEYVAVNARFAHPVPDHVSDEAAALIEPLAVALQATKRVEISLGARVTVIGAGPIGLLVTKLLRLRGAHVTVSDPRDTSRRLALEYGADSVLDPTVEGLPRAEILFDCSGNPGAIFGGIDSLLPAGTAVLVGVGPHAVEIPLTSLRRRELTITSSFRYAHVYPLAIELVSSGQVDLDRLVTHRFPLEETEAAFVDAIAGASNREAIKSVVHVHPRDGVDTGS